MYDASAEDKLTTPRYTAIRTDYGKPDSVRFTFDSSLRQAPWHLYAWGCKGYESYVLPKEGTRVVLPAMDIKKLLLYRLRWSS